MSYPPADSYPPPHGQGSYPPPPRGGYPPPQQGGQPRSPQGGYPTSHQGDYPGYPQGGHPGSHGGYPGSPQDGYPRPQQGGYPGAQQGGYPGSQQGGYPGPQQRQPGGYPPDQQPGGYPQHQPGGYPPDQQHGGYPPPQQGGFPPHQAGQPYGEPTEAAPPPKKSRAGRIVLIVVAVVLVLCVGGAAITWFAVKDEVSEGVEASRTRVEAPATLAGRPKVTDPTLQSLSDQMVTEMKKTAQGETSAVGGFYGDPAKQDLVMVVGVSGLMADPKKELDEAVSGMAAELGVKEMKPVEAGPLGGEARCGDGKADDAPLGVCLWADKGSVGAIVVFFKSAEEVKADFVTMRGEIEKRG
ncbi:hypothetical protein [Micromonospora sp. WMMD812]|uniref:hypothetical protein n=1 Tax=Micromonospora sp. WMMD812 TaxID=3015152 RepID=UPI00248ADB41|nr:hypothetical protein [Micromonospora sp. WMMD812]WBB70245.1 hypothetical protein O7603_13160 [Micromonospora sp. WMMD812]